MAKVVLRPSGRTFPCDGKQTILEAALSASISLPYGCSGGTCGDCRVRLAEGEIEKVKHHDFTLKEAERSQGHFLACSHAAASPVVVIEGLEAHSSADIPLQVVEAKMKGFKRVAEDIGILSVQTPRTNRLRFLPTQNVRLTVREDLFMDLPVASCPCDDRNLEFHLRRSEDEAFSKFIFDENALPHPVRIEGPWGQVAQSTIDAPALFLAFDTHIAPARSLIEQELANESEHAMDLFWFAGEDEFYLRKPLAAWRDAFDNFSFELITAERDGVNPQALKEVLSKFAAADLEQRRVFVAGPDDFVDRVQRSLHAAGVAINQLLIHSIQGGSNMQGNIILSG